MPKAIKSKSKQRKAVSKALNKKYNPKIKVPHLKHKKKKGIISKVKSGVKKLFKKKGKFKF